MSEKKFCVYAHINKINNKAYVGITSRSLKKRWGTNGYNYRHQSFYNAIQKYGWDNFYHVLLEKKLSHDEAAKKEIEYIKLFDSYYNGYNNSLGGESTNFSNMTDVTKRKISDTKKKNGTLYYGEDNPMHGKSMKDFLTKEEYEIWRTNVRNGIREHYKEIQRPVICINTLEIFSSVAEAAAHYNTSSHQIYEYCNNHKHSSKHRDQNGHYLFFDFYESGQTFILRDYIIKYSKMPVICIENNEVYVSSYEASQILKLHDYDINANCKHKLLQCPNGQHFMFYKEYDQNGLITLERNQSKFIHVKCLTTNTVYRSVTRASEECNTDKSSIIRCCKGQQRYTKNRITGEMYEWEYCV